MQLNSLDVLILLKINTVSDGPWSQTSVAHDLLIAQSQVHSALKRLDAARLYNRNQKRVSGPALLEFLVHGAKYVFPPTRGGPTRGIPTGYAAPPLSARIAQPNDLPPVWPHRDGNTRGYEFEPLDRRAPQAALQDSALYELLTLVDAIRDGRRRESDLAASFLQDRIGAGQR